MYSVSGAAPWQSNGGYGQPNGHPAYIPVPTRNPYASSLPPPPTYVPQPLNHSSPAPPTPMTVASPAPSNESKKKTEWSPAVRAYVNRCFAAEHQIPGIERSEMEMKLREVITNAAQSNMLNSYNWANMPLPQQMIAEDRKRATLGLQSVPPNFVPPPPPLVPLSFIPGSTAPHSASSGSAVLRKRKSSEMSAESDNIHPPWRSKKGGSLEDRMSAPDKRPRFDAVPMSSKSNISLEQRKRRFDNGGSGSSSPRKNGPSPPPAESLGPVVGRSEKLEKNYFRLTSAPNPDDVRPLPVLRQTLELLKQKWRKDNNYGYICDQFKSLRQDLTVQHIKNSFTTDVYEIHARIALEKGDLGEYNQCQSQLRALYKQNLGGHPHEFKAYRILYYIYTCNRTDMNDMLSELTPADKQSEEVKHALAVRSALALGNYHQFFKLYNDPPKMGAYLMDMFIERERLAALAAISKSYKPAVRLRFITEELTFESEAEAAQFILDHEGKELLEEKDDYVQMKTNNRLWEEAKMAAFKFVDIKGQI
ncbi:hypothetical protein LTR70_004469 [Exophiala xenobiotica]|uniref:PCI domain-containing protein n=1 Tax=Lithohypha guttulata TaxID=1690604 RepID=A0ABR0KDK6_9EURO|nr:hypothetical protein LTR24_003947 [Lithohypha guttulata]KAK5320891.1 hypothetical protein LTR70_004469 [Exophiala xenobiotica]